MYGKNFPRSSLLLLDTSFLSLFVCGTANVDLELHPWGDIASICRCWIGLPPVPISMALPGHPVCRDHGSPLQVWSWPQSTATHPSLSLSWSTCQGSDLCPELGWELCQCSSAALHLAAKSCPERPWLLCYSLLNKINTQCVLHYIINLCNQKVFFWKAPCSWNNEKKNTTKWIFEVVLQRITWIQLWVRVANAARWLYFA